MTQTPQEHSSSQQPKATGSRKASNLKPASGGTAVTNAGRAGAGAQPEPIVIPATAVPIISEIRAVAIEGRQFIAGLVNSGENEHLAGLFGQIDGKVQEIYGVLVNRGLGALDIPPAAIPEILAVIERHKAQQ